MLMTGTENKTVPAPVLGRPTKYSEELTERICDEMIAGKSLRAICREDWSPAISSVLLWLAKYPIFSAQYDKARHQQSEAMFEEMMEIADDTSADKIVDADGNTKTNNEAVNRSRLRVDTRKWALARMAPKKYGEKVQTEHSGLIETRNLTMEAVMATMIERDREKLRLAIDDAESAEGESDD